MSAPLTTLDKLCVHTITTKAWTLEQCVENFSQAGVKGITVWRQALQGCDIQSDAARIHDAGMKVV